MRRSPRILGAALGALLASATSARAQEFGLAAPERYTLPNGLEVILGPDERLPSVAVWVRYDVGSRDDPDDHAGLAHMVEHMTYRGSRHVPQLDMLALLESAGAEGTNGATHPDWTAYYAVVPAHQVPLVLWLESERMAFTLEAMNEAAFQVERAVVQNEIALRTGVGSKIDDFVDQALYPESSPYHRMGAPGGDEGSLTLDDVRWFYQRWYRPDNATLTLVGSFDPERVKREIEKYFGPIRAAGERPARARAAAEPLRGTAELRVVVPKDRNRVELRWLAPCALADCGPDLLLLQQVLAGSPEAPLRRALVRERMLASDVSLSLESYEAHTRITIAADAQVGVEPARLREGLDDALRRLQAEPVEALSLQQAKIALKTDVIEGFSSLLSRAEALANYRSARGRDVLYQPNGVLAQISDVTPEALQAALERYLPLDRRVVVLERKSDTAPSAGRLERQTGSALPPAERGTAGTGGN